MCNCVSCKRMLHNTSHKDRYVARLFQLVPSIPSAKHLAEDDNSSRHNNL